LLTACTQAPAPQTTSDAALQPPTPAGESSSSNTPAAAEVARPADTPSTHPCELQDDKALPQLRLRAGGTEPFWAADIQGRCVTYKTPENQAGTRVWTKFVGTAASGSWSGSLGGKPFVLKTMPDPKCSDGMSDNVYPIAVSLTVAGEQRSGCARP
jgi:uncharacterized membrane protein